MGSRHIEYLRHYQIFYRYSSKYSEHNCKLFLRESSVLGGRTIKQVVMPRRSFNLKPFDATCEFARRVQTPNIHRVHCPYAAERHHRQRDRRSNNPGYELSVPPENTCARSCMEERSRHYLFFHTDSSHIAVNISRSTLLDGAKNRHVSFMEFSQRRQTLAPEEEQVLLD
jgi:hypothetical protein